MLSDVTGDVWEPVEKQAPDAGGVGVEADDDVIEVRIA
jgi:hypothetical protein